MCFDISFYRAKMVIFNAGHNSADNIHDVNFVVMSQL